MKMQRRTFIAAAGAAVAASAAAKAVNAATSGELVDVKIDPWNQPKGVTDNWTTRFLTQDDESRQDFTRGMSKFLSHDAASPAAQAHQAAFLKSKGYNALDDVDMTGEQAFQLMSQDPVHAARVRLARSNFAVHWDNPRRAFHRDADYWFAEMAKTDKSGPGRLELNPALDIPDSARHEIHAMPGGYVGEPFAGMIYDLGHISGTDDLMDYGRAISYGQSMPLPADRKVRRILDIGCSMGNSTMGLKTRFPNAEVWGIDVGAPLLRWAHYKAVNTGYDIIYSQRNAESTGFPDGYFDAVASLIVFHEVAPENRQRIVKEIYRVLRPGGVYHHADFMTVGHPNFSWPKTVAGLSGIWVDHRHNVETWSPLYRQSDFPGLMKAVGFQVDLSGQPTGNSKHIRTSFPAVAGIKPV
jgi:ubiquinone/menaquinone biosynthesis C-methylase UbiE